MSLAEFLAEPGRLEVVKRGPYKPSTLSVDEKVKLALEVAEECVQESELRELFEKKEIPICYDGFEPSGRMHIAQGVLKSLNVNRLTKAGCVFVFWVADYFGLLNGKMGGDLTRIRRVGEYFIHVWKACGMDTTNVRFIWTSEEIARDPESYWRRVLDVSIRNSIARVKRCGQIMGRGEGDSQPSSQIMYPCMQCADIFYIGADICQLGMDQRKVNVLAREYVDSYNQDQKKKAPKKKKVQAKETDTEETILVGDTFYSRRLRKPVILSHHMLPGLLENQEKMSKSDPNSAIFMEDSAEDVARKIKKAFCPPGIVENNPIMSYVKLLILPSLQTLQCVARRADAAGTPVESTPAAPFDYTSYEELESDYLAQRIHPKDLKDAVTKALNQMIQPVRDYFASNEEAKQILADIKSWQK